jgi:hypothetical protein
MGSQHCEATLPKEARTREQVRATFRKIQDEARAEYGNRGCTGSFAEASGISILDAIVASPEAAHDHLHDVAETWGPALAVRALALPKSDSAHARLARAPLDLVHADRQQAEADLQRLRAGAIARVKGLSVKTKECHACGSAISVAHLRSTHCPVYGAQDFHLTQGEAVRRDRLVAQAKNATACAETARNDTRKPLSRIPDSVPVVWGVSAWGSC